MKDNKGITLIALVITIIVLLILAGVSIAMLTGENGVLTQATNASADTKVAEAKEIAGLDVSDLVAKYYEERYVNSNTTGANMTNAGAYVKANLTTSDSDKYTVETSTKAIKIVPKTRDGKTVTGTIENDGTITWTES